MVIAPGTKVRGIQNVETQGLLQLGFNSPNFVLPSDHVLMNVEGRLTILGKCHIGSGSRIDIGPEARVVIGENSYIHPFAKLVITSNLSIGNSSFLSWDLNIIDADFHTVTIGGQSQPRKKGVIIGNNVWLGSNVTLLAGTVIPDGCVIAASSTVRKAFTQENCLIAGTPAKVVRENVSWK